MALTRGLGGGTASNNLRGIIALTLAQALLVGSDTFIKLATTAIPASQIMALRGPLVIALMLVMVAQSGALRALPRIAGPMVLARAGLEAFIALLFIMALSGLPLGDITAILQATPLILTCLGVAFLGQRAGFREASLILLGFAGVVMVVQPGGTLSGGHVALALLVALLIAFRDLITRALDPAIPTTVIGLASGIAVCALAWAAAPFQTWQPMTPLLWAYVAGTGVLVAGANMLMVQAFRGVDLAVVSPFRYLVVVFAMVMAFAVWGDRPNALALGGVALIVLSGLILMRAEWRKMRRPELDANAAAD